VKTFRTSTPNNKNSDTSWIYQTTQLDPDEEDENFEMRPPQKPVLHLANVGAKTPVSRASVLVFEDPKSKALMDHIKLVAPSDANALIIGETGTGKEIIARHVHNLSNRSKKPFVAVNCGAFSENLIESELFGHERGAFTGASAAKAGWFETANGGTLFLDEIGELPIALQVKLLRVLQERQVVRLGSRKPVEIDVRFIAATNVQLEDAVTAGRFREDLYYRLKVASLEISPLRERPDDILPLARHFLALYAQRLGIKNPTFNPSAETSLVTGHTWPGNIRELENVIHHALLVSRGSIVRPDDLNLETLRPRPPEHPKDDVFAAAEDQVRKALIALFEENHTDLHDRIQEIVFRTAYEHCHRNQVQTAKLLGISRNIVRARLGQCGELHIAERNKNRISDTGGATT